MVSEGLTKSLEAFGRARGKDEDGDEAGTAGGRLIVGVGRELAVDCCVGTLPCQPDGSRGNKCIPGPGWRRMCFREP